MAKNGTSTRTRSEIPRRRSCRVPRFRGYSPDPGSGCCCVRSWSLVGEGSSRSCSGRDPAVAGPVKESERGADGRREMEITLKAARRSVDMAEGERVAVGAPQEGSRSHTACFYPRCERRCTPHQATLPHACSSFPRPFHPENSWDAPLLSFRPCRTSKTL